MATDDLSMRGRRLNNVGMPVENHRASNKFYVDTVIETATAGNKPLRKIRDGIFTSTSEIDMSGNSITGLPNPIDRDTAANKNYVDNGGAIEKLPNGAFTAISDIDSSIEMRGLGHFLTHKTHNSNASHHLTLRII